MGYNYDRREEMVGLAGALARRGWTLYGWSEDKSDSMTDYYCPAHWSGVATKGDCVAVVDNNGHDSGKDISKPTRADKGACPRCGGSGIDPSGWTLETARADPRRYHAETLAIQHPEGGVRMMFADVVSPIPFVGGKLCCLASCANGRVVEHGWEVVGHWPTYQGNPANRTWHVERGGRIIASGNGLRKCKPKTVYLDEADPETGRRYREDTAGADELAAKIDACTAERPTMRPPVAGAVVAVTVTENPEKDGVELRFPAKPAPEILDSLKAHGWRWSRFSCCWYKRASDEAREFARALASA